MASITEKYAAHLDRSGLNEKFITDQTKAILRIYRDLKWAMLEHEADLDLQLADAGTNDRETGLVYLTTFAPEIDLQIFESRVCHLTENKCFLLVIDKGIKRLQLYPGRGDIYHTIIEQQYLSHTPLSERQLLTILATERSVFYRRKKEAIFILGLSIFGIIPAADDDAMYEQMSLFNAC